MDFSRLPFLYILLPVACVAYAIIRSRTARNIILLIASLFFYAWGEPRYVLIMLLAVLVAYVGGLLMDRLHTAGKTRAGMAVFLVTVILLLSNLVIFKYLGFFRDNLVKLPFLDLPEVKLVMPIGISFYTFQILSYVIDLHRREIKVQKNFFYLALYLSFFPQLIAGPIVRYQTIEEEIGDRQESWDGVVEGTRRFVIGLSKKVILANGVARVAEIIYSSDSQAVGTAAFWVASLAYTLQIYFDFSGYSDMAIGMGRMFGFHFLENFNYPYVSLSVTEFWRRWHISLSSWFRDYVYIPMGGSRVGKGRLVVNLLVVWALTGFWHGASWNFLLWGLYYGVLLLVEKLVLGRVLERIPRVIRWLVTFFLVNLGWVLFNITDFTRLRQVLAMMFTPHATDWVAVFAANSDLINAMLYLPVALLLAFPVFKRVKLKENSFTALCRTGVCLVLFALCLTWIISSSYNPFIYFRF